MGSSPLLCYLQPEVWVVRPHTFYKRLVDLISLKHYTNVMCWLRCQTLICHSKICHHVRQGHAADHPTSAKGVRLTSPLSPRRDSSHNRTPCQNSIIIHTFSFIPSGTYSRKIAKKNITYYFTLNCGLCHICYAYFSHTSCIFQATVPAYYTSTTGTLRKLFIDCNCKS